MAPLTQWIRSLGGTGAVTNAAQACSQRRDEHAAVDARLRQIAGRAGASSKTAAGERAA